MRIDFFHNLSSTPRLLLEMEHVKPIVNDPDPDRKRLMISRSIPVKAVGAHDAHLACAHEAHRVARAAAPRGATDTQG